MFALNFALVGIGIAFCLALLRAWRNRDVALPQLGVPSLDTMSGHQLEKLLRRHFSRRGYRHSHTAEVGPREALLVLDQTAGRVCVQARFRERDLDLADLGKALAAPQRFGASRAVVVTNRRFRRVARRTAEAHGIELWDRKRLLQELRSS